MMNILDFLAGSIFKNNDTFFLKSEKKLKTRKFFWEFKGAIAKIP